MPANHRSSALSLTRRALLACAVTAACLPAERARAAPVVVVAAPGVQHVNDCLAEVTVRVNLSGLQAGTRYAIGGKLVELDTAPENTDECSVLPARVIVGAAGGEATGRLTQRVSAGQIGLWRGVGPASDEEESADLVELAARVWLRDLDAGEDLGQWQSQTRALVSRTIPQPPGDHPIDPADLMIPRSLTRPGDVLQVRPPC